MSADYFVPGQWNAICDLCGRKYKSGELRSNWKKQMVCTRCWEPRHPQDFVRARPDNMQVPWSRPEQADNFASTGHSAIAGVAIAGKAIAGVRF